MENKTVFQKGDIVYHWNYGKGIIISEDRGTLHFPVMVKFEEYITEITFTKTGLNLGDKIPTLSFTPYTLEKGGFSQERPQPVIEKGTPIWVKASCSNNWVYGRFVGFDGIGRVAIEGFDGIGRYFPEYSLENPLK